MCRYLRTVRSMAAASGFPLLGFSPLSAPARLAACLHSTPPRVSNMLHAVGSLPTWKSPGKSTSSEATGSEEGDARLAPENLGKNHPVVGLDLDLDLADAGDTEIGFATLLSLHGHGIDGDLALVHRGAATKSHLDRCAHLQA